MRSLITLRRALRRVHVRRPKLIRAPALAPAVLLAAFIVAAALLHPTRVLLTHPLPEQPPPPASGLVRIEAVSRDAAAAAAAAAAPGAQLHPLRSRVDAIVAARGARTALEDVYAVPGVVVRSMSEEVANRLYWKLVYADVVRALTASRALKEQPVLRPSSRVFFVHVQNGLGNRLRAVASGLALARATGRVPVVVWQRDAHLGARFDDLFESAAEGSDIQTLLYKDLIVMDSFPKWPFLSAASMHWYPVNYMVKDGFGAGSKPLPFGTAVPDAPLTEPAEFGDSLAEIAVTTNTPESDEVLSSRPAITSPPVDRIEESMHVYFKSAYTANTEPKSLSDAKLVNRELQALRPSKAVLNVFNTVDKKALSSAVGVHIRSRTLINDNVAVDYNCEYTADGAEVTNYWRLQSQLPVFLKKMKEVVKSRKGVKFFVAADDVAVFKKLEAEFPGRIMSINRNCDDRNESCVLYAMADLLSLARTPVVYGSNWSSFTEAGERLGAKQVYRSGVHFGKTRHSRHSTGLHGPWRGLMHFMRLGARGALKQVYGTEDRGKFTNCIRW